MNSQSTRRRAVALKGSSTGKQRYDLYRSVYARINQAIEQGFMLEAITLEESLISDRLESICGMLSKKDFSFRTFGTLRSRIHQLDSGELKILVCGELANWFKDRNKAIHEMAKIEEGDTQTWEDRMKKLDTIAKKGLALLRKVDKHQKALRKEMES